MRTIKLRDTLELLIDYRGKTPKKLGSDWTNSGYRAISALNVKNSGLVKEEQIRCVDEKTYLNWMKEEVKRGDLILTSEAPAGESLVWDSDEKIVLSQRVFGLRTKIDFSSHYLKYYLQSSVGQNEIKKFSSGSTVFGISAKMFDWIEVIYRTHDEQQQIAKVLSDLDAKIEVNNNINQELETLAKTSYDYWFVQFDFPDENGKPYKSSGGKMVYNEELKREIPEGYLNGKFGDYATVSSGYAFKSSNWQTIGCPVLKIKDITEE